LSNKLKRSRRTTRKKIPEKTGLDANEQADRRAPKHTAVRDDPLAADFSKPGRVS
jgi:hypothetical protein